MSKKLYEESNIQSIANAIREKNGTENSYRVSDMADAILDLPTSGTIGEILYNNNFTLNTTGLTFWDGTNTGTDSSDRMKIIDGWSIMQCTAEKVLSGLKIVPKKQDAYLMCQFPPISFSGKSMTIKCTVNGTEYSGTGTFSASGVSMDVGLPFGSLYCYTYSGADSNVTIFFVNQIDQEFTVSDVSMKCA